MSYAVAGNNTIAVLQVAPIVAKRTPKDIRQTSARFAQDNFRSACVPLFCLRRQMNIKIALLFDNQPDFDSHRPAIDFLP